MRELSLVVVRREAVEVVDQIRLLGGVHFDHVWLALPMSRENNYAFWLHFLRNFLAELDELRVDWMGGIIHDIWLFDDQ